MSKTSKIAEDCAINMNEHIEVIEKIISILRENKDKEKIRVSIQLDTKQIQAYFYIKDNVDCSILIQVYLIYEEDDKKKVMYKSLQLSHIAVKHIKDIKFIKLPPINNECN